MKSWFLGHNHDWVSFGIYSDNNPYNVPEGLFYSFPVTVANREWSIVTGLEINEEQRAKMTKTANELVEERKAIESLLKVWFKEVIPYLLFLSHQIFISWDKISLVSYRFWSQLSFSWCAIILLQKFEYFLLCLQIRNFAPTPHFILPISFLWFQSVIRKLQSHIMWSHSHLFVEPITSRKIHQSKRILIYRIMFYIYPVMLVLELAHSHVVGCSFSIEEARNRQILCYEFLILELSN